MGKRVSENRVTILNNERFILRLFQDEDCNDLLKVYSDKNALPFFNSDNCDGDNFYYATEERMKAIQRAGFTKSEHLLIGKTGYAYDGYWTI